MKMKKAMLVVESPKEAMDRAFSVMERKSKKFSDTLILSFPSYQALGKVITGNRLELLKVVREEKPKSIQSLAKILKRDVKNVFNDVKLLQEFGLIEVEESGNRKPSAPKAKFSELILAA